MLKFKTQSGSTYELDVEASRVRRLGGKAEPTARQGIDGHWREFFASSDVVVGRFVVLFWNVDGAATITSRVVEVTS